MLRRHRVSHGSRSGVASRVECNAVASVKGRSIGIGYLG